MIEIIDEPYTGDGFADYRRRAGVAFAQDPDA
jgi:hypothetical protein